MRIRRIKVINYAGIDEAEVMFPETGITIIEGDNEVGKTSLIAAVDMILEYLDTSGAGTVKSVMTVGRDVGPEVEVDISAGPYEFTYRKRWLRDKETILTVSKPRTEQLTGREAHNRVRQILDEAVDMELWRALRLDQGESLSQGSFDVASLGRALDAAAGGDVAGDREDVLFDRIASEYEEYWTRGGKARGDFRTAIDVLDRARERAEEAAAHLEALESSTEEIRKLESAATGLEQTHSDALARVAELTEQADSVIRIRRLVETSRGDLERAELVLENARQERKRRDELVTAVTDAEQEVTRRTEELSKKEPARQVTQAKQADANTTLEAARKVAAQARRAHDLARQDSEYARRLIEIEQLTERRDRIVAAQEVLTSANETLEAISIDADLLADIEAAHLDLAAATSAAARSQPIVRLKALERVDVTVDGAATGMDQGEEVEIPVAGESKIVIGETAEVTITAGDDDEAVLARAESARARYDDLCTRAGVPDFAQARVQADARSQAERDRTDAGRIIGQDLRDLTFEDLTGKIGRLEKRTAKFAEERAKEIPMSAGLDEAQEAEGATGEAADAAEELLRTAEARAKKISDELTAHEVEDASLQAHLQIAQSTLESSRSILTEARSARPDDDLSKVVAKAETAATTARAAMADVETELSEADPDTVEALLTNARAVLERSSNDLTKNRDRRNELRIELAIQTEQGPARHGDEAASALEEARGKHRRLEARANAARLLHEVFTRHRDAAHQRYNQPFRDRIEKLGRIVYGPSLEVHLSPDLSIARRSLDGTTLDFDQLSTGAREQLGLLARLACATLVSDEGGAPVIFDDALGWSDPGRLERMGAAISTASDECQIIVLTCVPGRYAAVGKATTVTLG